MKITFTIDPEMKDLLDGRDGALDWDTYHLISEARLRGHDVGVVQSSHTTRNGFLEELYFEGNKIKKRRFETPDALMVRGYGMLEGRECFDNLVDTVSEIERSIPLVINSGRTTAFSRKDVQKRLPLPFIPSYDVGSVGDVRELIDQHPEGIILKPVYGLQGFGIEYLDSLEKLDALLESGELRREELSRNYLVEKFVPEQRETRHIYLFGEHVGSRVAKRVGEPGKEVLGHRYLETNPDSTQLKIARSAIDMTGMDYGCVDFRGGHILEINGSGTQTFYRDKVGGGKVFLDLTSRIVDGIERRVLEAA